MDAKKGGASCPAGQAIRGESGQDGTPAPRPLLRPILVQAAGPWFDDHARPREQGHLISTRILRGPLGEEVATRYFLEDRWAQNAPTKGPPSVEGRGSKNSVHEITLDQGSPATKPADPSATLGWRRRAQSITPAPSPPAQRGGRTAARRQYQSRYKVG